MQFAQTTDWLEQASNMLIFGPSGTGKTHVCAALGHSMVELGQRIKFLTAPALVQQLQLAKLQLELQTLLSKLDRFDLLIIDDLAPAWVNTLWTVANDTWKSHATALAHFGCV